MNFLSVAAVAVVCGGTALSQAPTFSGRVDTVRVDALVTDAHGIVDGLVANDFELSDNGRLQRIQFVTVDQSAITVAFVLDVSASVSGARLNQLRAAINATLRGLKAGDRGTLVTFSHRVSVAVFPTSDWSGIAAAIQEANSAGGTSLLDAVYAGLRLVDGSGERTIVIVFTDGLDTTSWLSVEEIARAAGRSDSVLYTVSTASDDKNQKLRQICELTGGRMFSRTHPEALAATFQEIISEFRHRYIIGFTPQGVAGAGWHTLRLRVRNRNGHVAARLGYFVGRD